MNAAQLEKKELRDWLLDSMKILKEKEATLMRIYTRAIADIEKK